MLLISTSRRPRTGASRGFTVVEVLVGLALALSVAVVTAPLWISLENAGARTTDETIWLAQQRVASARLERDLRLASAADCVFEATGPLLQASANQVVFLTRPRADSGLLIVEWELAGAALMRRWGECQPERPTSYAHSLYVDHKTMLEQVSRTSQFAYLVNGVLVSAPVTGHDLALVEAVVLDIRRAGASNAAGSRTEGTGLSIYARVGR